MALKLVPACAAAYLAALPFVSAPVLAVIGWKDVVASDVAFAVLLAALALDRERIGPLTPGLRGLDRGALLAASTPVAGLLLAGGLAPTTAGLLQELLRTGYGLVVFLLFAHLRLNPRERAALLRTWVLTASVLCLAGLLAVGAAQAGWLGPNLFAQRNSANLGPWAIRPAGPLPTNTLSVYLAVSVGVALALGRQTAALPLLLLGSVATLSRGLVGLVVSVALLARTRVAGLAAAALLAGASVASLWAVTPQLELRPNAYAVLHTAAIRMALARPLAGVGAGEFPRLLREFTTPAERLSAWPPLADSAAWEPHSTWLGRLAETGLLGIAGWGVFFVWLLRRLRGNRPPRPGGRPPQTGGGPPQTGGGPPQTGGGPPQTGGRLAVAVAVGILVNGLHTEVLHAKFVWAFLGLALQRDSSA